MPDNSASIKYFAYLKISAIHFLISSGVAWVIYLAFLYAFALALRPLGEGAIFLAALFIPILSIIAISSITLGVTISTRYLAEKSAGLDFKIVTAISSVLFIAALGYTYLAFFIDSVSLASSFANIYEYVKIIDYRLEAVTSMSGVGTIFEFLRDLTFKKFEYTGYGISLFKEYVIPDILYVLAFIISSLYFLRGQFSLIMLKDETMVNAPRKNRHYLLLIIPVGIFLVYIIGFVLNPAFKYVAINYKYNEPSGMIRPIFTTLDGCEKWTTKKLAKTKYNSLADVFDGSYNCEPLFNYKK